MRDCFIALAILLGFNLISLFFVEFVLDLDILEKFVEKFVEKYVERKDKNKK